MTSYKKLYEEQLEALKVIIPTDYCCPLCGALIINQGHEYLCENNECKFDKTDDDLFEYYAQSRNLERID